jgi:ASC-1-like (ASCH) protein
VFHTKNEAVTTVVIAVRPYRTLRSYLEAEIGKALPGKTIEEGIELYCQLNTPEERAELAKKFGYEMLAIELRVKDQRVF